MLKAALSTRDAIFDRFELRMEEIADITKIRLLGMAKCTFGVQYENFPMMEFTDKDGQTVSARGIVIGDNYSVLRTFGTFTSAYDKTTAKIIPEMTQEPVSMVFNGEKLFLHSSRKFYPDLDGTEVPQDFYLAFANAVATAIEKDSKRILRFGS